MMKVIYKDLLENECQVFENLVINRIDTNEFEYLEQDARVFVKMEENTLRIQRMGEIVSTLTFSICATTTCEIESPDGCFAMDIKTKEYYQTDNRVRVVYDLLQKEEVVAYRSVDFIFED